MSEPYRTTTFRSRGKLTGLLRDRAPAVDKAVYYRARLILGDTLPRRRS
jgi:hypothetical protein